MSVPQPGRAFDVGEEKREGGHCLRTLARGVLTASCCGEPPPEGVRDPGDPRSTVEPVTWNSPVVRRRAFIRDLGKGTLAVAVLGFVTACGEDDSSVSTSAGAPATTAAGSVTSAVSVVDTSDAIETSAPEGVSTPTSLVRVDLGFVSAYVLARAGEAAVVDTGVSGSVGDIGRALEGAGLGWSSVGHVILTHLHPDHIGSLGEVLTSAGAASGYAGAADIPGIPSPRPLEAVGDGDRVFGLDIIATPGHTPGHISVLDPLAGILVAGDALNGVEGSVGGPNPQFTSDMGEANRSVVKLAAFSFEVAVFGHGEPVEGGASGQVADLAADL